MYSALCHFWKGEQNLGWISASSGAEKPYEINCVDWLKCICSSAVNTLCGLLRALVDSLLAPHPSTPPCLDSLHQVWVRGCYICAMTQPQRRFKVVGKPLYPSTHPHTHTSLSPIFTSKHFHKTKYTIQHVEPETKDRKCFMVKIKNKATISTISHNKGGRVLLTL